MEKTNVESIQSENILGTMPVKQLLRKFAVPATFAMLINALYNMVDQIFIGRGVGYLGNAATTVVFPLMTFSLALSLLFGAGGGAYAAIKLGEGKKEEAEKTLGNTFFILLVVGIFVSIVVQIFKVPILNLFGATEENLSYAIDYATIIVGAFPLSFLDVGMSSLTRSDGHPSLTMKAMIIGASLNVFLDPLFIFKFHWGVKGAAIATALSQCISASIILTYFIFRGNMRLKIKNIRPDFKLIFAFAALGISSFANQFVGVLLQVTLNNSLVYYGNQSQTSGNIALGAMGIIMKISMIIIGICIGIGIGSQPIWGFNTGAKKYQRVKDTYFLSVKYATIVVIVGWIGCVFAPNLILAIFGIDDPKFMDFAVKCIRIVMGVSFATGFQIVTSAYFQASGQPLKATILSLLRQLIILMPLLLILPKFLGLYGIIIAMPISDASASIITSIFAVKETKRLNKLINTSNSSIAI